MYGEEARGHAAAEAEAAAAAAADASAAAEAEAASWEATLLNSRRSERCMVARSGSLEGVEGVEGSEVSETGETVISPSSFWICIQL